MQDYTPAHAHLTAEIKRITPIKDGEEIYLVTRQHIIFFFVKTILAAFAIAMIFLLGTVIAALSTPAVFVSLFWAIGYFLIGIIVLAYAIQLHNYYLSKQILTNMRIIDYDQRGLFKAEVNETFLDNIENINFVQNTIWQTVFQFGSVDVQTAGQKTELSTSGVVFENVPHPKKVTELISRLSQDAKDRDHT